MFKFQIIVVLALIALVCSVPVPSNSESADGSAVAENEKDDLEGSEFIWKFWPWYPVKYVYAAPPPIEVYKVPVPTYKVVYKTVPAPIIYKAVPASYVVKTVVPSYPVEYEAVPETAHKQIDVTVTATSAKE